MQGFDTDPIVQVPSRQGRGDQGCVHRYSLASSLSDPYFTGWDLGIAGMQAGGERTLTIPSDLAYGKKGSGPIPANATLTFGAFFNSVLVFTMLTCSCSKPLDVKLVGIN